LDNRIRLHFFLAELQFCAHLERLFQAKAAFSSPSSFFKLKHRKPPFSQGLAEQQCCSELKTIEGIEAFSS